MKPIVLQSKRTCFAVQNRLFWIVRTIPSQHQGIAVTFLKKYSHIMNTLLQSSFFIRKSGLCFTKRGFYCPLYLLFKLLETLLAAFLIVVMENVFLYFSEVIHKRETQFVDERWLFVSVNGVWNAYEIKVGNGIESRKLAVFALEQPHFGVEAVSRNNVGLEVGQLSNVCRCCPPETARIHCVVARRPAIAAVSVETVRQSVYSHPPFIEHKVFQHLAHASIFCWKARKRRSSDTND